MMGFHVHERGDLSDTPNACVSTGGHYNPLRQNHGGPGETYAAVMSGTSADVMSRTRDYS